MTISALSSSAPLSKPNNRKFNGGSEFNSDFDFNTYETLFRGYDPQLGRFMQIDPLADLMPGINPYSFAFDNPISYNDIFGLAPGCKAAGFDRSTRGGRRNCRAYRKAKRNDRPGTSARAKKRRLLRIADLKNYTPKKHGTPMPGDRQSGNRTFEASTRSKRKPFDIAPMGIPGLPSMDRPDPGRPGPMDLSTNVAPPLNRIFPDSEDDDGGITINFPSDELFELGKSKVIKTPRLVRFGHTLRDNPFINVTIIIQMIKPPNARRGNPNSEERIRNRASALQKALIDLGASPRQVRDWYGTYGDDLPNVTFKPKNN